MKKIALVFAFTCACVVAQAQLLFSITTNPGEDAAKEMRVSWASDAKVAHSYVLYTEASDTLWRKAKQAQPQQALCTTYDSIYSKSSQNQDFYERWTFNKCGATLTNLKKNTNYMYRVVCDQEKSPVYRFRTAGAKDWSACIISDYHHYAPLSKRLASAMAMIDTVNAKDPSMDWVLHLGDVIAWGGSYSYWKSMYEQPIFAQYMWAGVNGNHDNMTRGYAQLTNAFTRDANFYPRNGYEGEEGVCYYFHYGDVLFVMLNNENMRDSVGLAKAQTWFRTVMQKERKKARYVVVCEHYQWFYGNQGKTSQYSRWCDLFDEFGVDLALAGNNHIYVRSLPLFQGKATDGKRGTVYLQTSSSDNERGSEAKEWTENRDLIAKIWTEGAQTVSALHMAVTPKAMTITHYDRHGAVLDCVVIPCKR